MKKFLRSQKGFTLIELLVVIAILGAIAGVVVLNIGQFIGKGKCEAYATEKHNVTTACIAAMYEDLDETTQYPVFLLTEVKYGPWVVTDNCSSVLGALPADCTE